MHTHRPSQAYKSQASPLHVVARKELGTSEWAWSPNPCLFDPQWLTPGFPATALKQEGIFGFNKLFDFFWGGGIKIMNGGGIERAKQWFLTK